MHLAIEPTFKKKMFQTKKNSTREAEKRSTKKKSIHHRFLMENKRTV
jgi:hypothetical protein